MARAKGLVDQQFSFRAPTAMSVMLAGDFTQWEKQPVPMRRTSEGIWSTTVSLSPGSHHYRFIVDGEWRDDPEAALRIPNPFGTEDAVREVQRQSA